MTGKTSVDIKAKMRSIWTNAGFGIGRLKDNEKVAAIFPDEMTQVVYYRVTPGTNLRRPTS
jgi:hypothetical protein